MKLTGWRIWDMPSPDRRRTYFPL